MILIFIQANYKNYEFMKKEMWILTKYYDIMSNIFLITWVSDNSSIFK